MSPIAGSKLRPLEFILTFAVLFFLTNAALNYFFPKDDGSPKTVTLSVSGKKIRIGNAPIITIVNETKTPLTLPARCPAPPVDILFTSADGGQPQELIANESILPCTDLLIVPAEGSAAVDLAAWKYALFSQEGTVTASLDLPPANVPEGGEVTATVNFLVTEPGVFTKVFRTFVTRPLFNALIFIASLSPNHNLGIAIILLTILIKLLLLLPNQHALEGQMKLQSVQPKMDELKKKYADDPKKMQEETMKLWKEMKINPLQSCLPILLQMPILIGLFFVIKDGVAIATSKHLLYSFYHDLPSDYLGHYFLGLDLLLPHVLIFPPLLVILQFIQMKMMMKKKKPQEIVVQPTFQSRLQNIDQQTIMTYVLPFMIGFFALSFPSAVSLYWGTSTIFGIAQQWFVMKKRNAAEISR